MALLISLTSCAHRESVASPSASLPAAAAEPARAESATPPAIVMVPSAPTPMGQLVAPLVPIDYGNAPNSVDLHRAPEHAADTTPAISAAVEAKRTDTHPERLSPLNAPAPFDRVAYERDPAAYLRQSVPGRAFQPHQQPTDAIPHLQIAGPGAPTVQPGGSVELAFYAPPGAPVSLLSVDLGTFRNGLTAITVQADAQGIARAPWTASGGVFNDVTVLAASPYAQGQAEIIITVAAGAR